MDIAEQIVDQGGHYVLSLKRNQPTLFDDVARYFADPEAAFACKPTVDADHSASRPETRSSPPVSTGCRTSMAGPA